MKELNPGKGGIQTIVNNLYEILAQKGFRIIYLVQKKKIDIDFRFSHPNITIENFPIIPIYRKKLSLTYLLFLIQFPFFIGKLRKLKDKYRNVIVHGHWLKDSVRCGLASYYLKIPAVWTCHGQRSSIGYVHLLLNRKESLFENSLKSLKYLVFVSQNLQKTTLAQIDIAPKTKIINNGIVVQPHNSSKRNDIFTIITASRLVKGKNIEVCIDALAILKRKGFSFKYYILGAGPLMESLVKKTIDCDLENEIEFVGFVKNTDIYYRKAHCYLSASTVEGMPLGPLEAMSHGIVPILSNIEPHKEIIEKTGCGFLFAINSCNEIAEILIKLTKLDFEIESDKAFKGVNKQFNILLTAEKYSQLFLQLLTEEIPVK